MTDNNGRFSFKTYRPEATLVISAVGYNEYVRLIHPAKSSKFNIALSPATYALDEVVVKPKRERYKKKDNPAVEFVRKMIEHRDDYSPDERDFWKRDRYEKMTFAINNFDSLKQQKWLYRKFKFLTDYVDTSAVTGRPVLAISNRELLATDYYRKSPHSRKQWVTARRQAGVDEMLSQQGMEQAISVTMTDVDLYENNITLFTNKFVSPLSSLGPSFYKYYLMDTLTVAGKPCVDLTFVPFNSESFGFTGHLYVMLDSTYFVKRAVMNFPQKINLNFVDYMKIEQNFDRAEDGTRQLLNESITTEFKLVDNSDGIYTYPAASSLLQVSLTFDAVQSLFTCTISNISNGTSNETPFSGGVFVVSNMLDGKLVMEKPFFNVDQKSGVELTNLAEAGNVDPLKSLVADQTGIITTLHGAIVVVYTGNTNPIYQLGQKDAQLGLAALAQRGDPGQLKASLEKVPQVRKIYTITKTALPGESMECNYEAAANEKVAFATMFGYSNDWFFANGPELNALTKGDITSKTVLLDDGTAVSQYPGAGNAQSVFGGTLMPEDKAISAVGDTYPVPAVDGIVKITIY